MLRITTLALLAAAAYAAPIAMAQTVLKPDHPRRAEVNQRTNDQKLRVDRLKDQGKLNNQQALQLHHEDKQIHNEQRAMVTHDGGHLTTAQQAKLNHQENAVNRSITQDKVAQ